MFLRMQARVAQCEALTMIAVQVFGNDHAVAFAGFQGNFQLNVYKPVMLHNVLTSIEILRTPLVRFVIAAPLGSSPIKSASESILVIV